MSSTHLVHPELRAFLKEFPIPEMTPDHLAAIRAKPAIPWPISPEVPGVKVEERWIAGMKGQPEVRVLLYQPVSGSGLTPAILHAHGGGYVLGAPEMADAANRAQAKALNATIVSVDYRLPPENPYPAPLDDCYAALKWLHAEAKALGVDPNRIAVKGESAGGGLAAGLCLLARDRGEVPVVFQCLTYPMIDDRAPSVPHNFAGEFVWTAASNRFGWACYLGREPGGPDISPYAAPARAPSLAGLPPTLIVAASLDLFVEDDLEYARRLGRDGVPIDLILYSGTYHGFQMAGDTAISRRYQRDIHEALTAAFAGLGNV